MSSCMGTETLKDIWLLSMGLQPASKHTHLTHNALRNSLTDSELSPHEAEKKCERNQGLPKQ